jgi:hypothetical protein
MAVGRRNTSVGVAEIDDDAMQKQALGDALGRLSSARRPQAPAPIDDVGAPPPVVAPPQPETITREFRDYIPSATDAKLGDVPDPIDVGGDGGATTPGEAGPRADTPPAAPPAATDEPPPGDPTAAVDGGAWARYGAADIPGAETLTWGDPTRVTGANTAGWGTGTRGSNTTKNSFLKIASRYDPRQPNASAQIFADKDFQRLFPEARLVQHPKGDQIDFGDGNPVDVLVNAREDGSGEVWAWQTSGTPTGSGGGAAVGAGSDGDSPALPPGFTGDDNSILDEIMASIDAMASGEEDPLAKKSIGERLAMLSEAARGMAGGAMKGSTASSANPQAVPTGRRGGVR